MKYAVRRWHFTILTPVPTPTPTPEVPVNPFIDVKEDDWFYEPVLWAVQNGVTGGTSPNTFSPENPCTRAQIVTFIWAANGKPEPVSQNNPFEDVKTDDWYYTAVLWAAENGITGGIGDGKFGPDQTCTRAQIAMFLYRAMEN